MAWYWPPSWFKKKLPVVVVPLCGHVPLTAEFFWMSLGQQLQVLDLLGVPYAEQHVILAAAKRFSDVKEYMATQDDSWDLEEFYFNSYEEYDESLTAAYYVARLKAVYNDGSRWRVIAVLQNIFRDKKEAAFYADKLKDKGLTGPK